MKFVLLLSLLTSATAFAAQDKKCEAEVLRLSQIVMDSKAQTFPSWGQIKGDYIADSLVVKPARKKDSKEYTLGFDIGPKAEFDVKVTVDELCGVESIVLKRVN